MGQYLVIGIATRIAADKKEAAWKFKSIEEFKTLFEKQFNKNGIFQMKEDESDIWFELRPEIAEREWVEFIRDFYRLRYPRPGEKDEACEVLSQENSLEKWISLAEEKPFECYQLTRFHHYLVDRERHCYLPLLMDMIILSLDGKIVMECFNELFEFFNSLIREKLEKYQLNDSLFVYLTD